MHFRELLEVTEQIAHHTNYCKSQCSANLKVSPIRGYIGRISPTRITVAGKGVRGVSRPTVLTFFLEAWGTYST